MDGYLVSYLVTYSMVTQRENKALIVSPMAHKKIMESHDKRKMKKALHDQ